MRRVTLAIIVLGAIALMAFVSGCGDDDNSADKTPTGGGSSASIAAVEKDFSISLDKPSANAGDVTFNIKNEGATEHEFVVIKTDLAPDKLPQAADGNKVDEDKVDGVGEKEDIDPGDSEKLSLDLKPGKYVIICNLPGHYKLGMHTAFTVN